MLAGVWKSQVTKTYSSSQSWQQDCRHQPSNPSTNIWGGSAKETSLQDNFPKLYLELQTKTIFKLA